MTISAEQLRLYAVTDRAWLNGRTLEDTVAQLIDGGVTCVQLREKNASQEEFLALAKALKPICAAHGVPLLINDNVMVAKLADADGVHIGQGDMSIAEARKILGANKIIGTSAHNVLEAVTAQAEGADYLGCGAMFGSSTKTDVTVLDRGELWRICKAVQLPVVAIGGITADNALALSHIGISGLAVVSALFAAPNKAAAAQQMRSLAETVAASPSETSLPSYTVHTLK